MSSRQVNAKKYQNNYHPYVVLAHTFGISTIRSSDCKRAAGDIYQKINKVTKIELINDKSWIVDPLVNLKPNVLLLLLSRRQ